MLIDFIIELERYYFFDSKRGSLLRNNLLMLQSEFIFLTVLCGKFDKKNRQLQTDKFNLIKTNSSTVCIFISKIIFHKCEKEFFQFSILETCLSRKNRWKHSHLASTLGDPPRFGFCLPLLRYPKKISKWVLESFQIGIRITIRFH